MTSDGHKMYVEGGAHIQIMYYTSSLSASLLYKTPYIFTRSQAYPCPHHKQKRPEKLPQKKAVGKVLNKENYIQVSLHYVMSTSLMWSRCCVNNQRALHLTECWLYIDQEMVPYKGRGVVPEPVCANKVRNGSASADQGYSIASQGSCDVHVTPCWNTPTSSYPAFFASTKPILKTDCANW